jgi:putative flippase GtrA
MFSLTIKYTLFAIISTIVNLGSQHLTLRLYGGAFDIYAAILMGTGTGLIAKYILDKKYIFNYKVKDKKDDFKKFVLYSLMGVITTIIFWGFEITFHKLFEFEMAKYVGALIGLSIGYVIKYNLDKKYVFK